MARLILIGLLLLSGCSSPDPNVIRFGVDNLPESFDPRYATDAASERVNHLLYRGLVGFDEQRKPIPELATWKRPQTNRYRFRLIEETEFEDGTRLTMQDVAATYRDVLNPDKHSPHRSTLSVIDQIIVIDAQTIEFVLKRADPFFPSYLVVGILPQKLLQTDHDFSQQPVGSGAFLLLSRDAGGVMLERKRDQQKLELVLVKDPSIRVLKLMRGEIHLLQNGLPPSLVEYLNKQQPVLVDTVPGSNFTYLGFNLEDEVTGDSRIREAVSMAIDRQAIIQHVFRQRAREALALFPPDHLLGEKNLHALKQNVDQAKKLLQAAGYDKNNPLQLTYKTSSNPFRLRLATIIQHQLAEAGIEVDIKSYDWGTFFGDIKSGNFQFYSLTWVGLKTPDSFRYIFHSDSIPPAGANRGRYRSDRIDQLIETAEQQAEITQQIQYYQQLQQQLRDDLPYIPMWYEDQIAAWRQADIEGYQISVDGNYDGLKSVQWKTQNTQSTSASLTSN